MMLGRRVTAHWAAATLIGVITVAFLPGPAVASGTTSWENLDARVRPPGAVASTMVFDEARGELMMFGGAAQSGDPVGTWTRRGGVWTREQTTIEPAPRHGAVMAYDAVRGETILFGGYVGREPTAETWIWDGTTWRSETHEIAPTRRSYASITYDPTAQRVILFGGITKDDSGNFRLLNDTWAWDGASWTELHPEHAPTPRNGGGMAYDEARSEVVLFGGSGRGRPRECIRVVGFCFITTSPGSAGDLGDTWMFDGTDWVQRSPGHEPPARSDMAMTYDPARQRITVFAGVSSGGSFNDTWTWDGTEWTEHEVAEPPERRFSPAAATDRLTGEVVIFGGHRTTFLGADTWGWDGGEWRLLDLPTPRPRFEAVMEPDPIGRGVLLFGGDADSRLSDTWIFDGRWTRLSPARSPAARAGAASAFDKSREQVVVFGGFGTDARDLADTWTWNGQNWSEVTPAFPALSPSARRAAAMAYDDERDEVVLFGGFNPGLAVFGDTWTWDGAAWELKTPLRSPPPLYDAAMVYDEARGEVVMFGGLDDSNDLVSDTWIWDGRTWTRREPRVAPRPRSGTMMAYDSHLEKVVLFSGLGSGAADVWMWDGNEWAELTLGAGPTRRAWGGFAASGDGLLLFGGVGAGYLDDTWLLRTRLPIETAMTLAVDGQGVNRILSARLYRADDPTIPIVGRSVDFYAEGVVIGSAITDASGGASLAVPPGYRGGPRDFEVRFTGDDDYAGSSARARG